MLKYFRVKQQPEKIVPDLEAIPIALLEQDTTLPFTIRQLNNLPENVKQRIYRGLIPRCPADAFRYRSDPVDECEQRANDFSPGGTQQRNDNDHCPQFVKRF